MKTNCKITFCFKYTFEKKQAKNYFLHERKQSIFNNQRVFNDISFMDKR